MVRKKDKKKRKKRKKNKRQTMGLETKERRW